MSRSRWSSSSARAQPLPPPLERRAEPAERACASTVSPVERRHLRCCCLPHRSLLRLLSSAARIPCGGRQVSPGRFGRGRSVRCWPARGDAPILAVMTTMVSGNTLAQAGALIGDPARANILLALMDGRALTAGELAWHAGVSAQTTSGHLGKLVEARLVAVVRQGRHRYHRLASAEVARAVEALSALAAAGPARHRPTGPRDEALRAARTCYDHLAGRLAVGLADSLCASGPSAHRRRRRRVRPRSPGRRALPGRRLRHRAGSGGRQAAPVPDLPRLERAPPASGRAARGRPVSPLAGAGLDRSHRDSRAVAITPAGRQGFRAGVRAGPRLSGDCDGL